MALKQPSQIADYEKGRMTKTSQSVLQLRCQCLKLYLIDFLTGNCLNSVAVYAKVNAS